MTQALLIDTPDRVLKALFTSIMSRERENMIKHKCLDFKHFSSRNRAFTILQCIRSGRNIEEAEIFLKKIWTIMHERLEKGIVREKKKIDIPRKARKRPNMLDGKINI